MTIEEVEADVARMCDESSARVEEALAKLEEAEERADRMEQELIATKLALAMGTEGRA